MASVLWAPNEISQAQTYAYVVTAVTVAGALTLTMGAGTIIQAIVYTCVTGDTTATAASALLALLQSPNAPPMFRDATYAIGATTSTIIVTAATPGNPFTLAKTDAGSSTSTLTATTANKSPSDVNSTNNWLRAGTYGSLPVNGDTVIIADSSIPMLWNLEALAAVQFVAPKRYQSMTGQIGLPDQNPNGYHEYRATYFQFTGSGTISIYLGQGLGTGPPFERYSLGATQVVLLVSGGQAIDFKTTNASNVATITGANVVMGPLVTDSPGLASATVDGGGSLTLGAGAAVSGTLTINAGTLTAACACSVNATNGSNVTITSLGATHTAITASGGSNVLWLSNSTITTLALTTGSTFDKSIDVRPMTVTNYSMDTDCLVNDPVNIVTLTNGGVWNTRGGVAPGPIQFVGTRTVTWV